MKCPAIYRLLNDLAALSVEMILKDPSFREQWHRVGMDARALQRLVIEESPTLAEVNARRGGGLPA